MVNISYSSHSWDDDISTRDDSPCKVVLQKKIAFWQGLDSIGIVGPSIKFRNSKSNSTKKNPRVLHKLQNTEFFVLRPNVSCTQVFLLSDPTHTYKYEYIYYFVMRTDIVALAIFSGDLNLRHFIVVHNTHFGPLRHRVRSHHRVGVTYNYLNIRRLMSFINSDYCRVCT